MSSASAPPATSTRVTHGRAVVVGLGKTGVSVARHLAAHGIPVGIVDSRREPPGLAEARAVAPAPDIRLGGFDGPYLAGAVELVVSPGVSLAEPAIAAARDQGVPVCGDVELFARVARAPVVGITGSNGKSTVTALLAAMALRAGVRVASGGNLGTPALDLLPPPAWSHAPGAGPSPPELYVLELSSFQLETVESLAPAAATLLNLSADHLDRYPDVERYFAAKRRILAGAGTVVVNRDDPCIADLAPGLEAAGTAVLGFTARPPGPRDFGLVDRRGEVWLARGGPRGAEPLVPVRGLRLVGRHNHANALAALALAEAVSLPRGACLAAVAAFGGLPHRCELVAEIRGVRWVNDSKGTNVGATVAAIEGLATEGPIVLVAGGDGKGADFAPLALAAAGRVKRAVLLGRDAPRIETALGATVPVTRTETLDAAILAAAASALDGDVVLLSPACASWDMFTSYEARGARFVDAVRRLETKR